MNIKLEDLQINNYMIYQDKDSFNFGIDAVLLANFALKNYRGDGIKKISKSNELVKKDDEIIGCDFCTGTLPIPLIMYAKRKEYLTTNLKIKAIEIDSEQASLCKESINYNKENTCDKNIDLDIEVINDDIKNIYNDRSKYKNFLEHFDFITCNPPYIKKGSGIVNVNDKKIIARHEVSITFDDICRAASMIIKSNKNFYIINHSERFTELVTTLKKYSFEVKKVQFVHPFIDKLSNLVLIEAVKNAKEGVKVLEPIIMY